MRYQRNIFVVSEGGLGNQLFQASFAHWLSLELSNHNVNYLEANSLPNRPFEIHAIFDDCPHAKVSKGISISGRTINEILSVIRRRSAKFYGLVEKNFLIKELNFIADQIALPPEGRGKFQIELSRFSNRSKLVLGTFQSAGSLHFSSSCFFFNLTNLIKKKSAMDIGHENFGILHVRRGDYTKESFGLLSIEYFRRAILECSSSTVTWILFTEDETFYLRLRNLLPSTFKLIDGTTFGVWDLLRLSLNTKVVIGSNSTLSWWSCALAIKHGARGILPVKWRPNLSTTEIGLDFCGLELFEVDWES